MPTFPRELPDIQWEAPFPDPQIQLPPLSPYTPVPAAPAQPLPPPPLPTPAALRSRVAQALHPFLTPLLSASYLLDTSPANALHVLTSLNSSQAAVTSTHAQSDLSADSTGFDFSFASEHLLIPQIALGDTYFGVTVERHETIAATAAERTDGAAPQPDLELRIGRFAGNILSNCSPL